MDKPIIYLDVGVDTSTSVNLFKSGVTQVVQTVNSEPFKIDVTINEAKLKADIQSVFKDVKMTSLTDSLNNIQNSLNLIIEAIPKSGSALSKMGQEGSAGLDHVAEALQNILNITTQISNKNFNIQDIFSAGKSNRTNQTELALLKKQAEEYVEYLKVLNTETQKAMATGFANLPGDFKQQGNIFKYFERLSDSIEKSGGKIESADTLSKIRTFIGNAKALAKEGEQWLDQLGGKKIDTTGIVNSENAIKQYRESLDTTEKSIEKMAEAQKSMLRPTQQGSGIAGNSVELNNTLDSISNKLDELRAKIEKTFDFSTVNVDASKILSAINEIQDKVSLIKLNAPIASDTITYKGTPVIASEMTGAAESASQAESAINQVRTAVSGLTSEMAGLTVNGRSIADYFTDIGASVSDAQQFQSILENIATEISQIKVVSKNNGDMFTAQIKGVNEFGEALNNTINIRKQLDSEGNTKWVTDITQGASAAFETTADKARQAIQIINEYYTTLSKVMTKPEMRWDIGINDTGFTSISGMYKDQANELNRLKAAADIATEAFQNNASVMQAAAEAQNAYKIAVSNSVAAEDSAFAQKQREEEARRRAAQAAQEEAEAKRRAAEAAREEARAAKEAAQAKKEEVRSRTQMNSALLSSEKTLNQANKYLDSWSAGKTSNIESSRIAYSNLAAATREFESALQSYRNIANPTAQDVQKLTDAQTRLKQQIETTRGVLQANGDATKSWSASISNLAKKFSTWFSLTRVIMAVYRNLKQMVTATIELDSKMADLQVVTKASDSTMASYGDSVAKTAKEIGTSIQDLITATTTYSRLGYTLDQSQSLAKYTTMLQAVGDIEANDAQDAITGIIKAFNIDVDQIEDVMNKLVVTGNNFPISVSQIAEGMNNASSALSAAGNSFEESVALLTAANTTVQNASKASTGLRTIAARIRNTKAELDELGEEAITTPKYEEIVNILTRQNVALRDANGEYRSTYAILQDIAAVWDKMTSGEQAALVTQLAGTRQQDIFYSIINNFKEASNALDAMSNDSANALERAYSVRLETVQAHINQFKAAWTTLGKDLFQTDFLKDIVDFGTRLVERLDGLVKFIDVMGGIGPLLKEILGLVLAFNAIKIGDKIATFVRMIGALPRQLSAVTSSFIGLHSSTTAETAQLTSLSAAARSATQAELDNAMSANTMATAETSAAVATDTLATSLSAIVGAIGVAIAAASFITRVVTGFINTTSSVKSVDESIVSAGEKAEKAASELYSLYLRYEELGSISNKTAEESSEFAEVQNQLAESLGLTKKALDEAANSAGGYEDSIKSALKTSLEEQADVAKRAMNEVSQIGKTLDTSIRLDKNFFNIGNFIGDRYEAEIRKITNSVKSGGGEVGFNSGGLKNGVRWFEGYDLAAQFDINNIEGLRKYADYLHETLDVIEEDEQTAGEFKDIWDTVYDRYVEATEAIEQFETTADIFNKIEARKLLLDMPLTEEIDDSEGFVKYVQSLIDAAGRLGTFEGEVVDIQRAILSTIKEDASFSEYAGIINKYLNEDIPLKTIQEYNAELEHLATLYNNKVNGNVDYAKRPRVSVDDLLAAGWEEDLKKQFGENLEKARDYVFTTWSHGTTEGELGAELTIDITPILEDGTVLSPESLQQYINSLDFTNGIEGLLESDKNNLVINVQEGEYDAAYWDDLQEQLQRIKDEYEEVYNLIDHTTGGLAEDRISFSELLQDDSFTKAIDSYVENVGKLEDALSKIKEGNFTNEEFLELVNEFPDLAGYADDVSKGIQNQIQSLTGYSSTLDKTTGKTKEATGIMRVFEDAFNRVESGAATDELKTFQSAVLNLENVVGSTSFSIDINAETDSVESLWSALKESESATGLSADSVNKLTNRYAELEKQGMDVASMFEKTEHGIHINSQKLRELESAYEKATKARLKDDLQKQVDEYNRLTKAINEETNAEKAAALYAERQSVKEKINDAVELRAQYEGLTSAYNNWLQAQETADQDDMYKNISSGLEDLKELYESGRVGVDDFRAAVQMMTDEDMSLASVDDLIAMYDKGYGTMQRFFTGNYDGLQDFADMLVAVSDRAGETFATIDEEGNYHFDFGAGGDDWVTALINGVTQGNEDMQDLQMSTEELQILLDALGAYGWDVNLDSAYASFDLLETKGEIAYEAITNAGKSAQDKINSYGFNFDFESFENIDDQIATAKEWLRSMQDINGRMAGDVDTAEYDAAYAALSALLAQKKLLSKPEVMSIDTTAVGEVDEKLGSAIDLLQAFSDDAGVLDIQTELRADTTAAQAEIQDIAKQLSDKLPDLNPEIQATLGLDTEEVQTALNNITDVDIEAGATINQEDIDIIQAAIDGIKTKDIEILTNSKEVTKTINYIDTLEIGDKDFNINAHAQEAISTIDSIISRLANIQTENKIYVDTYETTHKSTVTDGPGGVDGTANVNGTAYKNGDWATKKDGEALMGELGPEIIVRDGRFFTVGDNGAEFVDYKKGDIIFNHKQTEELLKHGRVTSNGGRGNALVEGTAFSNATGRRPPITGSGSVYKEQDYGGGYSGSSGDDIASSASEAAEKVEEASTEIIDWIEIAIDRIERAIDKVAQIAESTYKKLSVRTKALKSEIELVTDEIELQSKAAIRYKQEADSVGLSEDLAQLVRDGTIDIREYDEETGKLIKDYQGWYEKSLDCTKAVQELHETLASLYEDNFDNIKTAYENRLSLFEHLTNTYNSGLDELEARGYFASTKYYKALSAVERKNISSLQEEYDRLHNAFTEAMDSGEIQKYSEAWYSMQQEMNGVKEAIDEANISLLEYAKTMRELEWSYFDYVQDRVAQITQESNFLIDLLGRNNLYNDNGSVNNYGMATMGLRADNYNVYMRQADEYKKELLKVDKQLAADPYNQDIIERREELLKLQQDSIKAAEDEKDAIVDLVKDGIEIELDNLKELIDTYTDSLDSAKDLYEFQKNISEQTKNIASLRKQLSAYENDTSEETRAKIQKLTVDLESAEEELAESQYEKFVSDTKELLDTLYTEYEELLNQRLDDVSALIEDVIEAVNANATEVRDNINPNITAQGQAISEGIYSLPNQFDGNTKSINDTLKESSNNVGYSLTTATKQIWEDGGAAKNVVTTYGKNFAEKQTTTNDVINAIKVMVEAMARKSGAIAEEKITKTTSETAPKKATTSTSSNTNTKKTTNTNSKGGAPSLSAGSVVKLKSGAIWYYSSDGTNPVGSPKGVFGKASERDVKILYTNNASWAKMPYAVQDVATGMQLGWVKKEDIVGYRQGGSVDYTGLAMLHGSKANPETVLNAQDTKLFTALTDALRSIPLSALTNIATNGFNGVNGNSGASIGDISINIDIERVDDYNDFVTQLQQDHQFEKLIRSITTDRMLGGNSLAKNKFSWR